MFQNAYLAGIGLRGLIRSPDARRRLAHDGMLHLSHMQCDIAPMNLNAKSTLLTELLLANTGIVEYLSVPVRKECHP